MGRVKLKEQSRYEFRTDITVRISDLNYGNHVGAAEMTSILHDARLDVLRVLGFSEVNVGEEKIGLVVGDIAMNFKSEAFLQDRIVIESHIDDIDDFSMRLYHRVLKDDKVIVLAEVGIVILNILERKKVNIPKPFLDSFNKYLKNNGY